MTKNKLFISIPILFLLFGFSGSLGAQVPPVCFDSASACYNVDGNIYPQSSLSGCLNDGDTKYYRVPSSAGKTMRVSLNWSGWDCNLNDLIIYNSSCNQIASEISNNWTQTWEGISSSSDMIIGLDGNSSNSNCSWNLTVSKAEQSRLTVLKTVKNITRGDSVWYSLGSANPGDRLVFKVEVRSSGTSEARNIVVEDTLPSNMIYLGNLKINDVSDLRNIISGVNIGNLYPGQVKTITFEAQVASASNFIFGTTTLINTVSVYSSDSSDTNSINILIVKTGVAGATDVSTGLTNSIFLNSFLLPLLLSILIIWLFKSKIINFGKWADLRKRKYQDYKAKKMLQLKIAKIRAKEFIRKMR